MNRHQSWVRWCGAAAALAVFGAAQADGSIAYLTQNRRVAATGRFNGLDTGPLFVAPNFGPFNQSWTQVLGPNAAVVTASQNSQLLPEAILMDGLARVTRNSTFDTIEADALSLLDITFTLDAPSVFRIDHTHSISGANTLLIAEAILTRQTGPTGAVFDWRVRTNDPDTWGASPFQGVLLAGQYNLQVRARAIRSGFATGTEQTTVSFALNIPAPACAAAMAPFGSFALTRRRRADVRVHS